MMKIAVFVGSLRQQSINKKLALALMDAGKDLAEFSLVPLDALPMYNQDLETDLPDAVQAFKKAVEGADAVLFVTPEYNRSIPAVLKNAVDWASRPAGKNSWFGKPAAVAGTSMGAVGTAAVQQHLRSVMTMLGMDVMGQPEMYIVCKPDFFDGSGGVTSESTRKFFRTFAERFVDWSRRRI